MLEVNIYHRKNTDINLDGSEGVFNFYTVFEFTEDGKIIEEKTILSDYTKTFEDHVKNNNIENVNELFQELADYGDDECILKISQVGYYFVYGKRIDVTNSHILNALNRYTGLHNEISKQLLQLVVEDVYSKIVNISSDNLLIKEIITSVLSTAITEDELNATGLCETITDVVEKYSKQQMSI